MAYLKLIESTPNTALRPRKEGGFFPRFLKRATWFQVMELGMGQVHSFSGMRPVSEISCGGGRRFAASNPAMIRTASAQAGAFSPRLGGGRISPRRYT